MCTAGVLPPSATFLKSVNIWDTPSISRPESTSRTRKPLCPGGRMDDFSRIPMKPLLTSRPLTLCRKSVECQTLPDGWGEAAPLTGLLYCADCGGKMYVHRTNNGKRISQYTCSQYSKVPVGSSARHSTVSMKMWYCPLFPKCSKPLPSMPSMTEPSLSVWCRKRSPTSRRQRSENSGHALPQHKAESFEAGSPAL